MGYSLRAYEYWLVVYRRVWRGTIFSSFLNPVLYLSAIGVGLGKLVNNCAHPLGIPYIDFVAPATLAAVGMQVAAIESSFPVRSAIRWNRQYHAMLATPLRVADIVTGHLLYVATRVAVAGAIYFAVLVAFGTVHSGVGVLAWPSVVLIGLAFAAPISALSAWAENEVFNPLFRFAITPMFLFSGTFFPISRLPHGLRELAYATPLWHGVDLVRHLTLGTATWGRSLLHVAYLIALFAVGVVLARRAYAGKLVT
ncbi:MAG: lipooligosaccharide transport system permease protein [Gaiellaceae bacterium]|nr:lipooligosaccharide transport system permease protein [Gaiellaceae bacterium]